MIDRAVFFATFRTPNHRRFTEAQVAALETLLGLAEQDSLLAPRLAAGDPRHLAYTLATAGWETAWTWRPVEEHGYGWGRPYGLRVGVALRPGYQPRIVGPVCDVTEDGELVSEIGARTLLRASLPAPWQSDPRLSLHVHRWYGRGLVQLTHAENYAHMDDELGLGNALLRDPALALRPEVSWRLLVVGLFRGCYHRSRHSAGLEHYIDQEHTDYLNARRLVNGTDRAKEIADEALAAEAALTSALARSVA